MSPSTSPRDDGYLPIEAYGLIGDCRSAALVGRDGSIDWLCLPRFDDPSVFGRILDANRGGHWRIAPRGPHRIEQRYRDRTNLLMTIFTTRTGRVMVTDFMPVEEATLAQHARPHPEPRVVRLVECLVGHVTMRSEVYPAPDYARDGTAKFVNQEGMYHGDTGDLHLCVRSSAPMHGPEDTVALHAGDAVAFALMADHPGHCPPEDWSVEHARRLLRQTREYWWRWVGQVRYEGPYQEPVWRSALTLKLMTYTPSGAIIAAPTTSLPEQVGGPRNWDYRFTWLRDASFTLYAFFQLGLTQEAHAFFEWLARHGIGGDDRAIDNLYTLDGRRTGSEQELAHLAGYRGSRPVRIGNGAAQQLQLDVYGELLDSAYLYARFGGHISQSLWRDLHGIVEMAVARWAEPDASIWEVRGGYRHFTYSKAMCWVAVDRGLRLADHFGLPHDGDRWRRARADIHRRVLQDGWSERRRAFTQSFGSDVLDAAALRLSQVRFLPDHDERLRLTVDAVAQDLREGDLVRRYRVEEGDDGLPGGEGAFLACSFWLADAYAHLGELEQAQRLFERLLTFGSPLLAMAEEADQQTGRMLGNFPQAFTHLALVTAAVNIERTRHRQMAPHGL